MSRKEVLKKEPGPTAFVLSIDGSERRLMEGESINLPVSSDPEETEAITLFRIVSAKNCLTLYIHSDTGSFISSPWGYSKRNPGASEEHFDLMLSNNALHIGDGESRIKGSTIKINSDFTRLDGGEWQLEYRPL